MSIATSADKLPPSSTPPPAAAAKPPETEPAATSSATADGQQQVTPPTQTHPPGPPSEPVSNGDTVTLTDSAVGRDVTLSNTLNEGDINEIKNVFIGTNGRASTVVFSARMTEPITPAVERSHAEQYFMDEDVIAPLVAVLNEHRLLVLTAEPDWGKGATGLALARELRKNDDNLAETLRVRPLEADVRIDVSALVRSRIFRRRVVFFKDPLARGNRDLRTFLSFDATMLSGLRHALAAASSYLIFTADRHTLGDIEQSLRGCGVCQSLPPLSTTMLRRVVQNTLDRVRPALAEPPDVDEIVAHARSAPRAVRVLHNYLPQIRDKTFDVRAAFDRLDDAALRFHGELADDAETWTFMFLLTLALAVHPEDGIAWTEFERLRRLLLPTIQTRIGVSSEPAEYGRDRVSDAVLLRKTLSVVERDPATGRDTLKFQDANDADRLWLCLLENNRGLLTEIYPVLLECLKRTDRASLDLRTRAARIIGRLGESDPTAFIVPTFQDCAADSAMSVRASIGNVIEGAWSSRDLRYRERCLLALEELVFSDTSTEDGRRRIWSAIAACKRLGLVDLPLAMRFLQVLAEHCLAEPIADLRNAGRRLQQIEAEFRKSNSKGLSDVLGLALEHRLIRAWSAGLYKQRAPLLFAMQYTIAALCVMLGHIEVLRELKQWLTRSDELRALTVMVYLQAGGIAETLMECDTPRETIASPSNNHPDNVTSNPLVTALHSAPHDVAFFGEFLQDIFVGFRADFPADVQPRLQSSFIGHLVSMAQDAASSEPALQVVEDLFLHLLTASIGEIKIRIREALRTHEAFQDRRAPLGQFATRLQQRALGPQLS